MPGVKKLFQESENSAKPQYIHGHMFGGLGILAGSIRNWACIPLSIRLHDGLQAAREWKGTSFSAASHVVQMVEDAYHAKRLKQMHLSIPGQLGDHHGDGCSKGYRPSSVHFRPGCQARQTYVHGYTVALQSSRIPGTAFSLPAYGVLPWTVSRHHLQGHRNCLLCKGKRTA